MRLTRLPGIALSIWIVVGASSCAKSSDVEGHSVTSQGGNAGVSGATNSDAGDDGATSDANTDAPSNPCANVTCNTPPANTCANANELTVSVAPGTCDNGNCTYASTTVPCPNGCSAGACTGEPCLGVTCNSPPANTCQDSTTLTVYESGTCENGACTYGSHTEFCANGCANGACNGDPCVGVTCNSPPASYCSAANTLTVADVPGTCSNGTCSYTTHTEFCANGCAAGACKGDPCLGVTCNSPPADYCSSANQLADYPATGTCVAGSCTYTANTTNCPNGCNGGACVECTTSANCPSGEWCNGNQCDACNTAAHCGPSCAACSGATPQCNGTSCVAAGCTPPTTACSNGGSQDGGCTNAYRVSRTSAGSAAGFSSGQYGLCGRQNQFPSGGGCAGAGSDAEYRLFMRAGESVQVTMTKGTACNGFPFGNLTLKIFESACDASCNCPAPTTCQSPVSCLGGNQNTNFTATKDAWYTFVVDSESSPSGTDPAAWIMTFTLKLTCVGGSCAC